MPLLLGQTPVSILVSFVEIFPHLEIMFKKLIFTEKTCLNPSPQLCLLSSFTFQQKLGHVLTLHFVD